MIYFEFESAGLEFVAQFSPYNLKLKESTKVKIS